MVWITPLFAQAEKPSALPAALVRVIGGDSLALGTRTNWTSYPRDDHGTLWIGSSGLNRVATARATLVLVDTPRPGDSWLLGTISGATVYDASPRWVVNRDSLLVFDMIGEDYGWLRSRVVFWLDVEHQRVLASTLQGAADSLRWEISATGPSALVKANGTWMSLGVISRGPNGFAKFNTDSLSLGEGASPTANAAPSYAANGALHLVPGDPVVVVGERRLGRVASGDTIWTELPPITDSLKRLAWTYEGRYEEYDLDIGLGSVIRDGNRVFAGCSFYGGEGSNGVGGVVEYSASTSGLRVHRWPEVLHYSSGPLVVDGDSLWVALTHYGEGEDSPGGVAVVSLTRDSALRVQLPDVIRQMVRVGGVTLIASKRSFSAMEGARLDTWIPVVGSRGTWELIEITERAP